MASHEDGRCTLSTTAGIPNAGGGIAGGAGGAPNAGGTFATSTSTFAFANANLHTHGR